MSSPIGPHIEMSHYPIDLNGEVLLLAPWIKRLLRSIVCTKDFID